MVRKIDILKIKSISEQIMLETSKRIQGLSDVVEDVIAAMFARGHVLLEGVPGLAKTRIASTIAEVIGLKFSRISFTPDLMPADITGTTIFNLKTQEFSFVKGPVFSGILLCDEINRAPPKTQSALLEAMQEKQVTADGVPYSLPDPFFVIATQNPIEQAGTYPLPEAQLDRFLMRKFVQYPQKKDEIAMLRIKRDQGEYPVVNSVTDENTIKEIQLFIEKNVIVSEKIIEYIVDLIRKSREQFGLALGGSPRASVALMSIVRAKAAIKGRDHVIPDDIKEILFSVLNHRIILTSEAELDALSTNEIISQIVRSVPVVT